MPADPMPDDLMPDDLMPREPTAHEPTPGERYGTDRAGAEVLAVFTHVTGVEAPHGLDTVPGEVDEWSSLTQVRLVHVLEQRLGCELPERFLAVGASLRVLADGARAATAATAATAAPDEAGP